MGAVAVSAVAVGAFDVSAVAAGAVAVSAVAAGNVAAKAVVEGAASGYSATVNASCVLLTGAVAVAPAFNTSLIPYNSHRTQASRHVNVDVSFCCSCSCCYY